MTDILRVCLEPILPQDPEEMAVTNYWKQNTVLRVLLMGGDPVVREKVQQYAVQWNDYSNVTFAFSEDEDAEIRVAFDANGRSWSALGTDALNKVWFPTNTINFGWFTPDTEEQEFERVIVHEFGHALGCIHEHQNPSGGIPWDKPAVYAYYAKQGWSKEMVDQNLFRKWEEDQTQFSAFDRDSIMLYPVPPELTNGQFEVGWNTRMSETDKKFIGKVYPKG